MTIDEGQKLFTGSINQHLIEEIAALNVSMNFKVPLA
jgi:hypothetical protein